MIFSILDSRFSILDEYQVSSIEHLLFQRGIMSFAGMKSKLKGICHRSDNLVKIPLVSICPSGIGGEYQREA